MDWLNIHRKVTDSPEFVGSEPVDRSTWLCLSMFCAGQENGGRIVGCKTWGDRKWQQVVRVTLAEVRRVCDLWTWDGDDLLVTHYPKDKEAEVRAKREAGRATVAKRWGKRDAQQIAQLPGKDSSATGSANSSEPKELDTEGKGREGKGIEEEEEEKGPPPDLGLEPDHSQPADPIWSKDHGWQGITETHRARWKLAYPACDIDRQLAQMDLWLRSNPAEARKSNWLRFITNWLKRSQDNGGDSRSDRRASPTPTRPVGGHPFQMPKSNHSAGF